MPLKDANSQEGAEDWKLVRASSENICYLGPEPGMVRTYAFHLAVNLHAEWVEYWIENYLDRPTQGAQWDNRRKENA